jgi:hypothetical protein
MCLFPIIVILTSQGNLTFTWKAHAPGWELHIDIIMVSTPNQWLWLWNSTSPNGCISCYHILFMHRYSNKRIVRKLSSKKGERNFSIWLLCSTSWMFGCLNLLNWNSNIENGNNSHCWLESSIELKWEFFYLIKLGCCGK